MSTHHIINFSGGKDSTALVLLAVEMAQKHGFSPNVVFADTGHEHPITYEYVETVERHTGLNIRRIRADFSQEITQKRSYVMENWADDLMEDTPGRWERISRDRDADGDESETPECVPAPPPPADIYRTAISEHYRWVPARRGLSPVEAASAVERALSALHPTGNPFLDLCIWKGRFPSTRARFCSEELKHRPIYEQVMLPLMRSGRVLSWQGVRADESPARAKMPRMDRGDGRLWNWRPILRWTVNDVFAMHRRHGLEPNPLYKLGMGRVGCMPCIHARKSELAEIYKRFPDELDRVAEWEKLVSKCSKRGMATFRGAIGIDNSEVSIEKHGIKQIVEWSKTSRGGKQYDIFSNLPPSICSSLYGLCE